MSSFTLDGVEYRSHYFELPLNYQHPEQQHITVFARELVANNAKDTKLPYLVYLQGGPGFPSPRPTANSGWLKRALQQYRVILLDQRGTGLSSAITTQTIGHLSAEQQADYLSHFRADNIIRDAEAIREQLGIKQWSTLGQSFGGFCTLTYLSLFPNSLAQCFVTGGIPSIDRPADEVYHATYKRTQDKNAQFFARFPQAQTLCNQIAERLLANDVRLPNNQIFTVEQFQQMGIAFGGSGGAEELYFQLESALVDINGKQEISYDFLSYVLSQQAYLTNPIYAILHESIYCQHNASSWSAHRVRESYSEFNFESGKDLRFTGEMVYPWMFDQLETLKPLKQAAELLAAKHDWPNLYNAEQLSQNTVPLACAAYVDDMYVEFDFTRETLKNIPHSRAWMTNEYEHNGLRADGEKILTTLITMADDIAAIKA